MKIRETAPDYNNKYYLKKPGTPGDQPDPAKPTGWNPCILGNPINRQFANSVLANCVGGAVGLFNEIRGADNCELLGNRYPSGMLALARAQGLETGTEPRPGCACVQYGTREHIFIIGRLRKVGRGIVASIHESGWNFSPGKYFITRESSAANNWGMGAAYPTKGYIYHPDIDPYWPAPESKLIKRGNKGTDVKWLQWALWKENCYADNDKREIDGIFGEKTETALKLFQDKNGLDPDGIAGPLTQAVIIEKYCIEN